MHFQALNHCKIKSKSLVNCHGITKFLENNNTKESDIYSIGILMWELFSGHPPFDDRAHDCHLILETCKGLRPPILLNMPEKYVEMMEKCWNVDPSKRPTIGELFGFAYDF